MRIIFDQVTSIEELISDIPQEVLDIIPTDGAEQHDYYFYGSPKSSYESYHKHKS